MFASSYSCFLRNPALVVKFENWKRSLLLGLPMPRVCVCVPRHTPSHTHASRWSVHGHVYGKGEWQVGFGFAWHQEKLHKFLFCKEHHFQSVKESPCITPATWWLCQSSKLPKVQPSAAPSSGAQRLWQLQMCRLLAFAVLPGPAVGAWALVCVEL